MCDEIAGYRIKSKSLARKKFKFLPNCINKVEICLQKKKAFCLSVIKIKINILKPKQRSILYEMDGGDFVSAGFTKLRGGFTF